MQSWIDALHCSAVISETHTTKIRETVSILTQKLRSLHEELKTIMSQKGRLHLDVVNPAIDASSKDSIRLQVEQCEKHMEGVKIDMYRLECYKAAVEVRACLC